ILWTVRGGLGTLLCVLLLVSGAARASPTPPYLPESIAFWDAHHGIATFESCGQSNCLGEIATTEDSGKTWLVRWRHPRIGNVTVARGSNDAWVEDSANAVWLRSRDRGRTWRRMPGTKGLTELS